MNNKTKLYFYYMMISFIIGADSYALYCNNYLAVSLDSFLIVCYLFLIYNKIQDIRDEKRLLGTRQGELEIIKK